MNYESSFSIPNIGIQNLAAQSDTQKFVYGQGGRMRIDSSNFDYRQRINSETIRLEDV